MRIIGENIRNELRIQDPISGTVLTVYYRMPTSEERVAYDSAKYQKVGDKLEIRLTEAGQIFGEKIITGFPEGTFVFKGSDPGTVPFTGENSGLSQLPASEASGRLGPSRKRLSPSAAADDLRPFSSDPASPNYDPEWKLLLWQYASDVLEALGLHVFEGMRIVASQEGTLRKNS